MPLQGGFLSGTVSYGVALGWRIKCTFGATRPVPPNSHAAGRARPKGYTRVECRHTSASQRAHSWDPRGPEGGIWNAIAGLWSFLRPFARKRVKVLRRKLPSPER